MSQRDPKDFDAVREWALAPLLRAMREEARTGYAWNGALPPPRKQRRRRKARQHRQAR